MSAAEPGSVIAGRYELQAVLGRGGMGVVWLASDRLLHRDVAIKEVLWPAQLDQKERETLRERALREARAAARLDHPNIIRVYDVAEEDGRPWIVMQLARYPSLRDVVHDEGPLPPDRAARAGLQILAAIEAAHAAGVLHRDVKPGNVLLGPEDHAVLTDFGMAIADGSPTLTTSGTLIGSPSYMAPERARGLSATPAADLWSLGATLYAAVEGRPPFDREGTMAVLTAVVSTDPDPSHRAGPLWPVISGLLRKDPAERLTATEAERMLRRVADHGTTATATLAEPAAILAEPTSPLAAGAPAAAGRPAAGAADAPYRPAPRPVPAAPPPRPPVLPRGPGSRPPPRRSRLRWLAAGVAGLAVAAAVVGIALASWHAPARGTGSLSRPSSGPAAGHTGSRPPSGRRKNTNGPGPGTTPSGGTGTVALPAGFTRYHDPTGFSIGMPQGWQVSHSGHLVYITDPTGSRFLIIDQTTHPQPNPLADWRRQEAARIGTYPGYHRIRLVAVHYAQAERAADWEFTYYDNGQLTHVLNRNILANPQHAYALYWSTPQSQWSPSYHLFQAFAATFRPAGGPQGS